jgi:hypothetical protein
MQANLAAWLIEKMAQHPHPPSCLAKKSSESADNVEDNAGM